MIRRHLNAVPDGIRAIRACLLAACAAVLFGSYAAGNSAWRKVADLRTGGQPKEVALAGPAVERIMLRCVEGTVIINTVAVKFGAETRLVPVARRLAAGEAHVIELEPNKTATGLRISDAAKGRYEVLVQP